MNLDVNFFIYDDSNNLLGKTNVKLKRTTTSASRISLSERDQILEDLIYISIKEYTIKNDINCLENKLLHTAITLTSEPKDSAHLPISQTPALGKTVHCHRFPRT